MTQPATQVTLPDTLHVFERGWLSSNNILALGKHATVVDTSYHTHQNQTLALLQTVLGKRPLDQIINTHLHSDHCGGNASLQAVYPHVQTTISALAAPKIDRWNDGELTYQYTGQECPRFKYDAVMHPGQVVEFGDMAWQVLYTPGHDDDSVVLFAPDERILISADALWENGFGLMLEDFDTRNTAGLAFKHQRAVLEMIAALQPRVVIPGHGRPFSNVNEALDRAFSRIDFFIKQPDRHAHVASRVMIKFLLLQHQRMHWPTWRNTLSAMQIFQDVQSRYPSGLDNLAFMDRLADELVKQGDVAWDGEYLTMHAAH